MRLVKDPKRVIANEADLYFTRGMARRECEFAVESEIIRIVNVSLAVVVVREQEEAYLAGYGRVMVKERR